MLVPKIIPFKQTIKQFSTFFLSVKSLSEFLFHFIGNNLLVLPTNPMKQLKVCETEKKSQNYIFYLSI